MEQQLEELRLKEKKLIYLLGETMFNLYKSQGVRFLYTSAGEEKEKEVTKLVRLLDYIEDRIVKIEEIYNEEDAEDEAECECECTECESEEMEDSAEDMAEAVAVEPDSEIILGEESPKQDDVVALAEKLLRPDKEVELEVEMITPVEAVIMDTVENISTPDLPIVQETAESTDVLQNILESAVFVSEADKNLFEKNVKQYKKGTEREREVSINQISHTVSNEELKKVYLFVMKDSSVAVRLAVMKNISRMKENETAGFWELGLHDSDIKVRTTAIKGIGTHVTDAHREVLENLLNDNDPLVRGLAVTYLGMYYGKDGVLKALTAWEDESPYVRTSLIEMMSIVKPEGALLTIKNLLSDTDEGVKKEAEKALKKIMPERKREGTHDKRKR
ncbi:MAG: HEAT repeat domain-containing protein [Candidatus Omnitrophica bacterium]|nr:HEAT repeat domain-containing protein [Candidatus Omnitrophota bacterium]